jgi:Ca2+-binding RTX toxin-like protein
MLRKRSTRRFQFENLEARQLMAADLYLDFGAAFGLNSSGQQHVFNVVQGPATTLLNAPITDSSVPGQLTSLLDGMIARNIDYDLNGVVNSVDAGALGQDVADMVSRIYEPFAINVKIVASANTSEVNSKLTEHSTNDAYVLVGGRSMDGSNFGIAKLDTGNTKDNVAFAFAESLLDKATSLAADDINGWKYLVSTMARTAAHEAAHTFGLEHLLETTEGLTEDQLMLAGSDLMLTEGSGIRLYMNLATRWDGLPTEAGTQNAFNVLSSNVGLKPGGPAYVTGTGANDKILIEDIGNNMAQVTVSAFRDSARTDLIETQTYTINTTNGVLVEGGRRNDSIEARNLSVPVTLRGGSGDDELIGSNGNDTLEGDVGIDSLTGGAGSDTYLFRGPRYQDLNRDDISDASGADDMLDFSALTYAVNVDLASTSNQEVEYQRFPVTTTFMLDGRMIQMMAFVFPIGEPRLNLDLGSGTGSTGIENVRGTRFDDHIYGNELDNELFGNAGNDWLNGYDGIDQLFGGLGDDILRGGDKRDYLYGEMGRDQLFGDAGDDYLDGGFDKLVDVLTGGDGADEFVQYYRWNFTSVPYSPYLIQTYDLVEDEKLAGFDVKLGDRIVKRTVWPTV